MTYSNSALSKFIVCRNYDINDPCDLIKICRIKKHLENCEIPLRQKMFTPQEQKRADSKEIKIVVVDSHFKNSNHWLIFTT